jgi:NhaP-type Na+/H+ or K+/H+ antiporter
MSANAAIAVGSIVVLGGGAQWLAHHLRLPSILILLASGFLVGPVLGWLDPNEMVPPSVLQPIVGLFVGLILYEGGLSLNLREISGARRAVTHMATYAVPLTWGLSALAAHYVAGLSWSIAILIGAILIVSGPTVIIPMLQVVRPSGRIGPTIKWEAIVNDPTGALLAVLTFEVILAAGTISDKTASAMEGIGLTLLFGGGLGVACAYLLAWSIRKHWVPDHLHNAVSLMLATLAFTAANAVQHEAGLFAVTVMGVILANQRLADVQHIIEFKEHLRTLLIASLFILLSSRLKLEAFSELGIPSAIFVLVLVLLVRPVTVFLATLGTELNWREKTLLAWICPRGIVAAAVAGVFASELKHRAPHISDAHLLEPLMFVVIVGTVLIYGLTTGPVARWLKLADADPQGLLLIGAQPWIRNLGEVLKRLDIPLRLVDRNRTHISAAKMANLPAISGDVLSEYFDERVDLSGVGRVLALTPNDEVNTLALQHFEHLFGRRNLFASSRERGESPSLTYRTWVGTNWTTARFSARFAAGDRFRATTLSEEFNFEAYREKYGEQLIPVMIRRERGRLELIDSSAELNPRPGDTLISFGPPEQREATEAGLAKDAE